MTVRNSFEVLTKINEVLPPKNESNDITERKAGKMKNCTGKHHEYGGKIKKVSVMFVAC